MLLIAHPGIWQHLTDRWRFNRLIIFAVSF
jgi:hypothetical protein